MCELWLISYTHAFTKKKINDGIKLFLSFFLCFHFQFIILLYFCLESLNKILSGFVFLR